MTVDAVDWAFEEALTRVSELLEKFKSAWDTIVEAVNWVLSHLWDWVGEPIKSAFETCSSKVTEAVNEITKLFSERGSPSALRAAGASWNWEVGYRASTQVGLLAKEELETDNKWSGDAANLYGEVITTQGKALTEIKAITDILQTTLNEIASAWNKFWWSIAVGFGIFVVAAIVCAILACNPAGMVPALCGLAGAAAAFIGLAATLTVDFTNTLDGSKTKLDQQYTMDGQFAHGEWPSAVVEKMSGASVQDGNK